jgi:flagellar secretion chaperone FliS
MNQSTAHAAYRSAEVTTLSQRELIVRLYQGAERFLAAGRDAIAAKKGEEAVIQCRRARDIFIELMATLNFEIGGDVAQQLRSLYAFIIYQISEASLKKNQAQIDALLPIIKTLREGWQAIPDEHANVTSIPEGNHGHSLNLRC